MDKYITDNFTGSIDDLLNHCTNLDLDKVEEQVKVEEKEACIKIIMILYNLKMVNLIGVWQNLRRVFGTSYNKKKFKARKSFKTLQFKL